MMDREQFPLNAGSCMALRIPLLEPFGLDRTLNISKQADVL